jgi:hypothetical protein
VDEFSGVCWCQWFLFFVHIKLIKLYDRVDWHCLESTVYKMGFSHWWVQRITTCSTMVRYSLKFCGTQIEVFSPTRVLCQGDPLSALLFMFVADGLSTVLRHEVEANRLTPIKIHRRAPGIFHLLFSLKPSYR